MKVTPSPLVRDLRGKGAGAVCANWRGRNYARGYNAHPKNPQSAPQKLVRASMSLLVKVWQHLTATPVAAWNHAAKGMAASGFNMFVKANRKLQAATVWGVFTPSNPDEFPLATVTAGTLTATGCTLSWTPGSAVATHKVEIAVYKKDHPIDPAAVTEAMGIPAFTDHDTTLVSAGTKAVTGCVAASTYEAHVAVYNATTGYLSKSLVVEFTTTA
jgi:hypothetical protein